MINKAIKKILIPTDFGELADYAYALASIIAAKTHATIEVLSVITGPQGAFYSTKGYLMHDEGNDYTEFTNKLEEKKESMKKWIAEKQHISDSFCVIGKINDSIISHAKDQSTDLIIMGTEGVFNNSLWSKSTHTQFVSNHAPIPVLSLKCDRSDISLDEIVLVGDFLESTQINLDIVKTLQSVFDSKIMLLKIKTAFAKRTEQDIKDDMKKFAIAHQLHNYEMHIYSDKSVEAGIGKFAEENDIDLVIIGTHQHKGLSKLFRRSISDDIVNHLFHPVLTFPLD